MTRKTFGILNAVALGLLVTSPSSANAPTGRYSISNGTVKDGKTGLTWQQQFKSDVCWDEAVQYCAAQAGGWRVPTVRELVTLFDYSQSAVPFIDTTAFPGSPTSISGVFWSSTKRASDSTQVWEVAFTTFWGNVMYYSIAGATECANSVRCVR